MCMSCICVRARERERERARKSERREERETILKKWEAERERDRESKRDGEKDRKRERERHVVEDTLLNRLDIGICEIKWRRRRGFSWPCHFAKGPGYQQQAAGAEKCAGPASDAFT